MKILLINDSDERIGGAEDYFYNLKELLENNKDEVATYFSAKKLSLRIFGSIFSLRNLFATYSKIKKSNIDIVHINKYNLSLSVSPLISAKLLNKKTIVTFHDFGILCPNGWCVDNNGKPCKNPTSIKWVFQKSLSKKPFINKLYDYIKNKIHLTMMRYLVDIYIGPSNKITEYLKEIFDKDKVKHLPYFTQNKWVYKEKKSIKNKILFVGRLTKEKGIDNLILSLKKLDSKISLDIIGDGKEKEILKNIIQINNIKNSINFIGKINHVDLIKYYQNSDILVIPSIWLEQFGIVGLEAIACGTPVISTDCGGIRDWLKEGYNGIIIKDNSPENISKSIKEILRDKKKLNQFSKNGRDLFVKDFSETKHYKDIKAIYRSQSK